MITKQTVSKAPEWISTPVTIPGAPTEPQIMYHRDLLKCIEFKFGDPSFADDMLYHGVEIYENIETEGENETGSEGGSEQRRVYGEMNTADIWNRVQVSIHSSVLFPSMGLLTL